MIYDKPNKTAVKNRFPIVALCTDPNIHGIASNITTKIDNIVLKWVTARVREHWCFNSDALKIRYTRIVDGSSCVLAFRLSGIV